MTTPSTCPHGHKWIVAPDGSAGPTIACPQCAAQAGRAPDKAPIPSQATLSQAANGHPEPVTPPADQPTAARRTRAESTDAASASAGNPIVIPGYEILGELGRGGM